MSYIPRAIAEEIRKCFETSKSLAITGARQVGKITVTRHLYPGIRRINMRDSFLYSAAKDDPLGFLKGYGTPLFIDEVRNAPFLLDEAKVVLDEVNMEGNCFFRLPEVASDERLERVACRHCVFLQALSRNLEVSAKTIQR